MIKVISVGRVGLTGKDGATITVNDISSVNGNITLTAGDVGADNEGAADQAEQNANDYTDQVAATKLDAADYVQHFKGKFTSLSSLQESYPTATDGDYAIIDAGTGTNARQYVWDSADGWVDSGEVKSGTTTDQITEGSSNLYFTTSRVRDVVLTGLSLATNAAITAADTVLTAFGKLQKQITDLATSLTNGLLANLTPTINTQTGTAYTVNTVSADNDGKTILRMTSASANTVEIPSTLTLPISIRQAGTGTTTLQAGSGVTLNGTLAFSAQHQTKTIYRVSSGIYDVVG